MPKSFLRPIALVLVSCLLGSDPSWSVFARPIAYTTKLHASAASLYREQALIARGSAAWRSLIEHNPIAIQIIREISIKQTFVRQPGEPRWYPWVFALGWGGSLVNTWLALHEC